MPDTTLRPRRSVLYMPGANERALEKAKGIDADALILDLEDSVSPDAKEVVEAMGDGSGAVMINGKMEDDASCKQCIVMLDLAKALAERDPELAAAYDL